MAARTGSAVQQRGCGSALKPIEEGLEEDSDDPNFGVTAPVTGHAPPEPQLAALGATASGQARPQPSPPHSQPSHAPAARLERLDSVDEAKVRRELAAMLDDDDEYAV